MRYLEQKKKIRHLFARGKNEKAINLLEKEIAQNIDSGLNALILYEYFISRKNEDDALAILQQIRSKAHLLPEPLRFDIYWHLGYLHFKQHNYRQAFINLEKAYRIKEVPSLLAKIGQIYLEVGKTEEGGRIFSHLHQTSPQNHFYQACLGYYYIKSGRNREAETLLQGILEEDPAHELANFYLGYYFYTKQIYDSAEELFDRIKADPELKSRAHYYTGLSWETRNDRGKMIEHLNLALENTERETPLTLEIRYLLAGQYEELGDLKSAFDQLVIIYNHSPRFRDVAGKLDSDFYRANHSFCLKDYNTLPAADFLKIAHTLLNRTGLQSVQHRFLDKAGNILLLNCKRKTARTEGLFLQQLLPRQGRSLPALFIRTIHLRGAMLQEILAKIPFRYSGGLLISSGRLSPLTLHDARQHNFDIITPSRLRKILSQQSMN